MFSYEQKATTWSNFHTVNKIKDIVVLPWWDILFFFQFYWRLCRMNITLGSSTSNLRSNKLMADDFPERLKHFCQLFRFYSSVILVVVGKFTTHEKKNSLFLLQGMIGSLLSIKVFSSTKIRRNSSNEYLITSKNERVLFWWRSMCPFFSFLVSFVIALLLFNFFCDEVLRSLVHDFNVDLPLNLVDLSRTLCKCKLKIEIFSISVNSLQSIRTLENDSCQRTMESEWEKWSLKRLDECHKSFRFLLNF